jgi:hypothetical protein
MKMKNNDLNEINRREFLRKSSTVALGAALLNPLD